MIIEDFFRLQMFSSSVRVPGGKLFRFSLARSLFAVTFTIRSLSSIPRSIRTAYIWDRAENFPPCGAVQRRVDSRSLYPALNSRRIAVGTSPANRRLRFTTGSSYFYERHSAAEIFSLVLPGAWSWKRAPKDFSRSARATAIVDSMSITTGKIIKIGILVK